VKSLVSRILPGAVSASLLFFMVSSSSV